MPTANASVLQRIGVGLWTMRSMASAPRNRIAEYRAFREDAALAERLGFHSIWSAEHRVWYDGWCPAPLHAQAYAAAGTKTIRFGNAVLLAPQHDPFVLARTVAELDQLSGGRVDLGIGLGHRDAEFDAVGLRRDRRGRRMDNALDAFEQVWSGRASAPGQRGAVPAQRPGPPVWIGGMAKRAIERATSRGHNLILPQTIYPEEMRKLIEDVRGEGAGVGMVGTVRDVWVEPKAAVAKSFRARFATHFTEEAGSWWILKGKPAFQVPQELARQMSRIVDSALIGSPEQVAGGLRSLFEAGVQFLMLRINFDMVGQQEMQEQLERIAATLAPLLRDVVPQAAGLA